MMSLGNVVSCHTWKCRLSMLRLRPDEQTHSRTRFPTDYGNIRAFCNAFTDVLKTCNMYVNRLQERFRLMLLGHLYLHDLLTGSN